MFAKAIRNDAGDRVRGPARGASSDDGNGPAWIGLGADGGGGQQHGPGGEDLATLHGFLLLFNRAGFAPASADNILAGQGPAAKGLS